MLLGLRICPQANVSILWTIENMMTGITMVIMIMIGEDNESISDTRSW